MKYNLLTQKIKKFAGYELKVTTVTFFVSIIFGFISFFFVFTDIQQFNDLLNSIFADVLKSDYAFKDTFVTIFQRNSTVAFLTILLGVLYKFLPLALIIINGILIGIISAGMISLGLSIITLLLNLLPHGIFEIPAFLLASAIGIRLSSVAKPNHFINRLKVLNNSKPAILVVFILLFIAALIESYLIVSAAS